MGIPSAIPTRRATITKDIKESNLNARIRTRSRHIPRTTIRSGIGLLVTGYWLLVTGYWLLVTGYWLLVTGYWLLVTGY
ncbi:MAG: hypothetical protein MUC93_02990, partial [Bacteroidales bacterium]|nr:hypothetical protein [Bacteroidales bacterium]